MCVSNIYAKFIVSFAVWFTNSNLNLIIIITLMPCNANAVLNINDVYVHIIMFQGKWYNDIADMNVNRNYFQACTVISI